MTKRQRLGYFIVRVLSRAIEATYKYVIQDRVWRSADGTVTTYRKLDKHHLKNILHLLERQGKTAGLPYTALLQEYRNRRKGL